MNTTMKKKGEIANIVRPSGRYWYVNPYGNRHAVNIRDSGNDQFVIFDDNKEIPKKYLRGYFEYRK